MNTNKTNWKPRGWNSRLLGFFLETVNGFSRQGGTRLSFAGAAPAHAAAIPSMRVPSL